MNNYCCTGRLTKDPEVRSTKSGNVTKFCVAVDRRVKNATTGEWESDPNFLDFEAWDKAGESVALNYKKGDFILIDSAYIKTDRWKDQATQENRSRLVFVCTHLERLPKLNFPDKVERQPETQTKPDRAERQLAKREPEPAYAGVPEDEDGIPF